MLYHLLCRVVDWGVWNFGFGCGVVSGPWVMHGRLIAAQGLAVIIDRLNCRDREVLCSF